MSKLDKTALRQKILQQRQSLSPAEWQRKSNQICDRLKSDTLFKEAETILAYFSFRQEPDLAPLFNLNKNWAFPRCVGKYGILEPNKTATTVDVATADLILVPTVACDTQGYRLGYGGGFYDRLLSIENGLKVTTIGIVFDFGHGVQLPKDPWDRPLNFVCTEIKLTSY